MCTREIRVDFDRAIKHPTRVLQGGAAHLIFDLTASKIILVGAHAFGGRFFQRALFILT